MFHDTYLFSSHTESWPLCAQHIAIHIQLSTFWRINRLLPISVFVTWGACHSGRYAIVDRSENFAYRQQVLERTTCLSWTNPVVRCIKLEWY